MSPRDGSGGSGVFESDFSTTAADYTISKAARGITEVATVPKSTTVPSTSDGIISNEPLNIATSEKRLPSQAFGWRRRLGTTTAADEGASNTATSLSPRGSRPSHNSSAYFAGEGENGLCCIADDLGVGLKEQRKALGMALVTSYAVISFAVISIAVISTAVISSALISTVLSSGYIFVHKPQV